MAHVDFIVKTFTHVLSGNTWMHFRARAWLNSGLWWGRKRAPEGWPEDYAERSHKLEKLLGDIEKGKKALLDGLDGLSSADLKTEITRRGISRTRQMGLFGMLAEVVHHNGQIAYLRGTIKRHMQKDPQFLK